MVVDSARAGYGALMSALVLLCAICWMINPDAWIADDSYFYLVIARNFAWDGALSFSGIMPTNGFHPLWGWLLVSWASVLTLLSPEWLMTPRFGVALSFLCLLIAVDFYRRFASILGISSLTLIIPIAFISYFGVLLSEGHLSLLALTSICLLAVSVLRDPVLWRLSLFGLLLALTVLARLDNLFVVGFVLLFVTATIRKEVGVLSLIPAVIFLLLIGLYMLSNNIWYGGYMPVSGWMKSSFPNFSVQGFHGGANPSFAGVPLLWGWGSMALSAWICFRTKGESKAFLVVLLLGLASKNAYIALFTRSHTGWYWYSTLDVFVLGFALAVWVGQGLVQQKRAAKYMYAIALFLSIGMFSKAFSWSMPADSRPARGLSLVLEYTRKGDTLLVSDYPGYVAFYAQGRHIFAADMLTSNRHWYNDMRQHENAFEFVKASCAEAGKPLTHVLWNGNSWLVVSSDKKIIDFNDPRTYPVKSKIGEIRLESDPIAVSGDSVLWKL